MAWLQATPEAKDKKVTVSRLQTFKSKEALGVPQPALELPEVEAASHLLDYLFEVGPMRAGEAITFQEIEAWTRLTGAVLTSWEAATLSALSAAFASEFYQAKDPGRPAPTREAED